MDFPITNVELGQSFYFGEKAAVSDRPTLTQPFSKWCIITKQPYTWTHIVNSNVCVGLFGEDTPKELSHTPL